MSEEASMEHEREALAKDILAERDRLAGRITPSVWRLMDRAIKLLRNCDCQHPDPTPSGFAAVSVSCPIHGEVNDGPIVSTVP